MDRGLLHPAVEPQPRAHDDVGVPDFAPSATGGEGTGWCCSARRAGSFIADSGGDPDPGGGGARIGTQNVITFAYVPERRSRACIAVQRRWVRCAGAAGARRGCSSRPRVWVVARTRSVGAEPLPHMHKPCVHHPRGRGVAVTGPLRTASTSRCTPDARGPTDVVVTHQPGSNLGPDVHYSGQWPPLAKRASRSPGRAVSLHRKSDARSSTGTRGPVCPACVQALSPHRCRAGCS